MRGFELIEELHTHFKVRGTAGQEPLVRGTAGQEPLVRDKTTGTVFKIVGVETEYHGEDATGELTHWILVEEY